MKKALSMIENAVPESLQDELELYVLIEANNIYRDAGMFESAAIYSYKAKHSFPGEFCGYLRLAQDLSALGMNQLAVHVIDEGIGFGGPFMNRVWSIWAPLSAPKSGHVGTKIRPFSGQDPSSCLHRCPTFQSMFGSQGPP